MELIDKQKLLEWLDNKADARLYDGVYRALIEVFNEIKSGTFDAHSTQYTVDEERGMLKGRDGQEWFIVPDKLDITIDEFFDLAKPSWVAEMQEEIAKLKEERNNIKCGRDNEIVLKNEVIKQYEDMEARAIQAERERDARYEFDKQRTIRLEEERNALLEGLKEIGRLSRDGLDTGMPKQAMRRIDSIARSIITKIENK